MAAAVRNKSGPPRKGAAIQDPNPPRRTTAWRGASNPPSNAYSQSPRLSHQFPPLGVQNGAVSDSPLPPPALIGSTIVVSTRSGQRYEGALVAVPAAADGDAALQLKDVKDLVSPGTPLKDSVTLPAGSLANWSTLEAPAKANGDFRTDADIGGASTSGGTGPRRERELQAWQPDENGPPPLPALGGRGDDATFGPGSHAPNGSWDQFAANERMFGVTTSFDEETYTTKIDRSTPDFKERERKAQALANEILSGLTNNPHVAEERNLSVDDSGVNEEDKYAGVTRGPNAYVPPARRAGSGNNIPQVKAATPDNAIPQVSVTDTSSTPTSKPTSPSGGSSNSTTSPPTKDLIPTFRDFVTNEKQRLTQKRQAIVKNEMDKRMSELVKFSQSFKLNKPIPDDLVAILAKDAEKQRQIREKSTRDAASSAARSIGGSAHTANAPVARAPAAVKPAPAPSPPVPKPAPPTLGAKKENVPARIPMVIQKIPPFNPNKLRGPTVEKEKEKEREKEKEAKEKAEATEKNATGGDAAFKLSVNASSFKLKPNAPSFKPVAPSPSPKSKPVEPAPLSAAAPPVSPNPFFGTRVIKKSAPVHVKDDFNPFKSGTKVPDASTIAVTWAYTGKRYAQMFPSLPPPPVTPQPMQHIPPAGPPVPPPPPFEEDPQHRGYGMVYAYAPYAYPGQPQQPMMAGAPPSGPPGNYMPSPFLQPMHYPPMPPNGHPMYAPPPSMGNMPPPQQYMQPPPPYAPPPNGAGRGSMPPTPMPPHAHAYAYHQSPQLSHAVPYQMMMHPPPNGPPHTNYENGPPPVPMGGVGHA